MVERRWLLRLVPPVIGALAVGLLAATSIGAADGAWVPPACPGGTERLAEAARLAGPEALDDLAEEAWFTLDPWVDTDGVLAGQRLRIGAGAERARFVELPRESAAAGPFGRVVLVVADDGRGSEIQAIDRRAGCAWHIAKSPEVVRRVTLDPAATAIYESRVDRTSRADLGVWRRPLDGSQPRRVLQAPRADRSFGVTFTTTLGWSTEGDRLVVQSCGALRCRSRLLDPATDRVETIPGADQGELVGVAGGRVVTYAACPGLPCPIVATEMSTGRRIVLDEAAALARLVVTSDGPRVAIQAGPRAGTIRLVRLDGTTAASIRVPADSLDLMPGPDRASAGTRLPPGWLVLAPDGRSPDGAVLTRLTDGATVGVREVTR